MRAGATTLALGTVLILPFLEIAHAQNASKVVVVRGTDEERTIRKILQGQWVGHGLTWRIDQDAFQANRDPKKPFDWRPLQISNITSRMILFQIGFDRYVGILDEDDLTLSLTSNHFEGTYVLKKQPAHPENRSRGSTPERSAPKGLRGIIE